LGGPVSGVASGWDGRPLFSAEDFPAAHPQPVVRMVGWLHHYNHHRPLTAVGNLPFITRCTNVPEQYT
jgi:hypothetical protein